MAKKLLHYYTFIPSTNTIEIAGIYRKERFLIITNVTTGEIIYAFNDTSLTFEDYTIDTTDETTTLELKFNCSGMSPSDKLQIFVEVDTARMEPSETFVDPVSKIRVSQPENLIDTDFEYGLQSSKWETLELVKNIPTFFSRNGDEDLEISSISTINGSDKVTVICSSDHGIIKGNPIIVLGTRIASCNGGFVVTNVISSTTFQYLAKNIQNFTGTINDTYSQVYVGSVYQGTEFKLSNIDAITTDGETTSTITVSTEFPTNFVNGTSFFLSNSLGQKNLFINAGAVIPDNFIAKNITTTNITATGETDGFALGAIVPYTWRPTVGKYFTQGSIAVNTVQDTITFYDGHQLEDNKPYLYILGYNNTLIGGLTDFATYYIRVIDSETIYLTAAKGGTTRVNLTSAGANAGIVRSCFARVYKPIAINVTTNIETITFDEIVPGVISGGSQALMPVTTTVGNLAVATGSTNVNFYNGTVYYPNIVTNNGVTFSVSALPNGSRLDLTNATVNGFIMPVIIMEDRMSMWFSNHGLSTGDVLTFSVVAGTLPGGLTNNGIYVIEKVNENRVRFRAEQSTTGIILTNIGSTNGQYRLAGNIIQINNDSVFLSNHGLSDGDPVTYTNEGNGSIGGLVSGNSYYVFASTTDRFKLATTKTGYTADAKTVTQNTTNISVTGNTINITGHGFTTGVPVQYLSDTPIGGLLNGAIYWVYANNANTFTLHFTQAGSLTNNAGTIVNLAFNFSGSGTFRACSLVDISAVSTGVHKFSSTGAGASDGVYSITSVTSSRSFSMATTNQISSRTLTFVNAGAVYPEQNCIRYPDHFFVTGTPVVYTSTDTPPTGLVHTQTYYVIRLSRNWIRLAESYADALTNTFISLSDRGSGSSTLTTNSISGEILGPGTVTIALGSHSAIGLGTTFSSIYNAGDTITFYQPEATNEITVTAINATTDVLTATGHGISTGDLLKMNAGSAPGGTSNGQFYYAYIVDANNFTIHNTYADASANTNKVNLTDTGSTVKFLRISSIGSATDKIVKFVAGKTYLELTSTVSEAFTSAEYGVGTSLLVRADGFALHRPYDGGVELIPSTNPDSQMIRQTRKYFRYQSGKGIQVSFAVNFSPTTTVDSYIRSGYTGILTTRIPHRLTAGLSITISGATVTSGVNFWNGTFIVTEIPDEYTFKIQLDGLPLSTTAEGLAEFYVNSWSNSSLRCGLFDDQNGLYFDFDGTVLRCCRRSSVQQLSGVVSVTFKSAEVIGFGTKFLSQLSVGDRIVLKGQTYRIVEISSDTLLYVLPSYRGISTNNVVVTKTVDTKIPQTQWNVDVCDGYGPSGFYLDIHKIQMAYMDYSWYGAGKVRFGFKDQSGKVIYVHEFIHNNKFTEAYMRSGNLPARYDIENQGNPTYVPSLAHWGTSVIMDGRFDDDKAYVFTASSNQLSLTGTPQLTISARFETLETYYGFFNNQWRELGRGILLAAANSAYNAINRNLSFASGAGLQAGTLTALPRTSQFIQQPYQASVNCSYFGGNFSLDVNRAARNLLLIDRQGTVTSPTSTNYVLNLSSVATPVVYDIPLISIRLSPSVDTNTPGFLGEREILNRMQLILSSVGILSTHSVEITLKLNPQLNTDAWQRVNPPSLSQLIYHTTDDSITGGTIIFSFRAQGGTGTTGRSAVVTTQDLGDIATLGNSILGGNGVFPDGPDVLTVVAKLVEDPSTVTSTNPFNITGRISWSESQA